MGDTGTRGAAGAHLGGQVLGRPAEGLHGGAILDALLAQPEVGDLDVPVLVQHEVLQLQAAASASARLPVPPPSPALPPPHPASPPRPRSPAPPPIPGPAHLEVPVHHVLLRVQVVQGGHDLGAVEPGPVLGEHPLPGQVEEELRDGEPERGRRPGPGSRGGDPNQAGSGEDSHPDAGGSERAAPGTGPYLASVGVLHDEAQAVVGLEGVLQGLRGKQSWNPALQLGRSFALFRAGDAPLPHRPRPRTGSRRSSDRERLPCRAGPAALTPQTTGGLALKERPADDRLAHRNTDGRPSPALGCPTARPAAPTRESLRNATLASRTGTHWRVEGTTKPGLFLTILQPDRGEKGKMKQMRQSHDNESRLDEQTRHLLLESDVSRKKTSQEKNRPKSAHSSALPLLWIRPSPGARTPVLSGGDRPMVVPGTRPRRPAPGRPRPES